MFDVDNMCHLFGFLRCKLFITRFCLNFNVVAKKHVMGKLADKNIQNEMGNITSNKDSNIKTLTHT